MRFEVILEREVEIKVVGDADQVACCDTLNGALLKRGQQLFLLNFRAKHCY